MNEREQPPTYDEQTETPPQKIHYRFAHGSFNFKGKNLIRAVKQAH
jgi:hypothetical protein